METLFLFILITSGFVFLLLIGLNIFLIRRLFGNNKKVELLFGNKKSQNLKDILIDQFQKLKSQHLEIEEILSRINKLESSFPKSFQKIGVVRFNPFSDMGGNQSFVIALLDGQNNGFVVSSLFIKEGNRVYAKAIKAGKCDYPLSKEEEEAIGKAINL